MSNVKYVKQKCVEISLRKAIYIFKALLFNNEFLWQYFFHYLYYSQDHIA